MKVYCDMYCQQQLMTSIPVFQGLICQCPVHYPLLLHCQAPQQPVAVFVATGAQNDLVSMFQIHRTHLYLSRTSKLKHGSGLSHVL